MKNSSPGSVRAIRIVGLGNVLLGDEGVGVHAVRGLEGGDPLPPGVECVDGGTGSMVLLQIFEGAERLILIDAAADGRPPGTITRLEPRFASDYPPSLSAHDIGLRDVLESMYLLGRQPPVTLFTVSIALPCDMTVQLSRPVAACLPELARRIRAEIAS